VRARISIARGRVWEVGVTGSIRCAKLAMSLACLRSAGSRPLLARQRPAAGR
jgi:hypothetical protein